MNRFVFDASAILAYLHREPGWELVEAALITPGFISAVNVAELVTKLADAGMSLREIDDTLEPLNVERIAFDQDAAYITGLLRPSTRRAGLSLGDRACLALGIQKNLPVLTSDQAWRRVPSEIEVRIEFIR